MAIQRNAAPAPSPASAPRGATTGTLKQQAQQQAVQNPNAQSFASLNPEDFTQGGLLDDVDVVFSSVTFVEWDYNGAIDHPVLALLVAMEYEDNGAAKTADQYYSAGDLNKFIPSADGTHATAVGGAKGLPGGSNAAAFLKSVIDSGFPVDQFGDGDVSRLNGMSCHINRVAQPKRGGNISGKTGSGFDATVALVTKIHRMPWEDAKKTAAPKGAPVRALAPSTGKAALSQATQATQPEAGSDVSEEAAGILLEILAAKGGTVTRATLPAASFKPLSGNPNRAAILALFTNDEFLNLGENYGWVYDAKSKSISTAA